MARRPRRRLHRLRRAGHAHSRDGPVQLGPDGPRLRGAVDGDGDIVLRSGERRAHRAGARQSEQRAAGRMRCVSHDPVTFPVVEPGPVERRGMTNGSGAPAPKCEPRRARDGPSSRSVSQGAATRLQHVQPGLRGQRIGGGHHFMASEFMLDRFRPCRRIGKSAKRKQQGKNQAPANQHFAENGAYASVSGAHPFSARKRALRWRWRWDRWSRRH